VDTNLVGFKTVLAAHTMQKVRHISFVPYCNWSIGKTQQDRTEDTQPSSLLAKNWRCRELDSGLEQPKLSDACDYTNTVEKLSMS